MQTYTVKDKIVGSYSTRYGKYVVLDYEPGEYTPKDRVEAEAFVHIAAIGAAVVKSDAPETTDTKRKRPPAPAPTDAPESADAPETTEEA